MTDLDELDFNATAAALDAIGNQAAAFADTLYRFGGAGGTKIIQKAMNDITPSAVAQDGQMGPQTLAAYQKMAADPGTRGRLLDQVAKARGHVHDTGGDAARNDYFRFRDNR